MSKERINGTNFIKETYCKGINNISFIEGNFLKQNISDATVVYCDNTMYDKELTEKKSTKEPGSEEDDKIKPIKRAGS